MPIDRKLALEPLRETDEELYHACNLFEELREYLKDNNKVIEKLQVYLLSLEAMDELERKGEIEIINDYDSKAVYLKRRIDERLL